MTAQHRAAGDGDVFAGNVLLCVLGAGLDGDAVVAHVDVAAADAYIAAAFGVNAVGIGRVGRIADGDIRYGHVIAAERVHRPRGAVDDANALNAHALAVFKANRIRASRGELLRSKVRPPAQALALDRTKTRERDILCVLRVDQRTVAVLLVALPARIDDRIQLAVVREA